jgi:hypothetical protein
MTELHAALRFPSPVRREETGDGAELVESFHVCAASAAKRQYTHTLVDRVFALNPIP